MLSPGEQALQDAEAQKMRRIDRGVEQELTARLGNARSGLDKVTPQVGSSLGMGDHQTIDQVAGECQDPEWAARIEALRGQFPQIIDHHAHWLADIVGRHNIEYADACHSQLGQKATGTSAIAPEAEQRKQAAWQDVAPEFFSKEA